MSLVIEEFIAALAYQVEGEENLKKFRDGIDGMQKRLENFAARAADVGRKVALGITAMATAASAALMGAFKFATAHAEPLAKLDDVAARLGVNVESLQELRHAAEMGGMGVDNFDVAFRRFIRRSSEAAKGTGAAKDAFKELGIRLRDSQGNLKQSGDLLAEVADRMTKVKEPADRLRLAFKLFDTDGAAMVKVLAEGSEGLKKWAEHGWQHGMFFTQEDIDKAAAYTDALDVFRKTLNGLRTSIALDMMPALTDLTEGFTKWYRLNQGIIRQRIGDFVGMGARAIETFGTTVLRVAGSVEWLSKKVEELTGLTAGDQTKALGAGAVGWLATRHPVLAALSAAFLLLDDFRAYMEGDNSLIGDFLAELDKVQARVDEFRAGKEAETGLQLVPKSWFEQLLELDEALMRTFRVKPGDLDISQLWGGWNLTSNVLQPMWLEFEVWWDNLVQGFHDAGARSGSALLDGLMSVGASIREWFASLIPEWARGWTVNVEPVTAPETAAVDPSRMHERFTKPVTAPETAAVIPSPFDPAGIRDALQRLVDGAAGLIGDTVQKMPSPVTGRAAAANAGGGQFDAFLQGMENFSGWMERVSPENAADTVTNTVNDHRDQSVIVNSTVNQTVQQATQAPAAAAQATSSAVGSAAVPPARRISGN